MDKILLEPSPLQAKQSQLSVFPHTSRTPVSVALQWIQSMYLLYGETQNWIQRSGCGLTSCWVMENSLPWPASNSFYSPRGHWPSLVPGHVAGRYETWKLWHSGPSLSGCLAARQPPVGSTAWCYSASDAGHCFASSWTWGCHWTINSACYGSSGWQHNQRAYHSVTWCIPPHWKLINLFRVLSWLSTRSLMKMLKQYQPLNQPWGTLLLTGLQTACADPLSPVFCPLLCSLT